jgi:hypothetical protein
VLQTRYPRASTALPRVVISALAKRLEKNARATRATRTELVGGGITDWVLRLGSYDAAAPTALARSLPQAILAATPFDGAKKSLAHFVKITYGNNSSYYR